MNKILYVAYYSDPEPTSMRKTAPAADTKINYIVDALKQSRFTVNIFSESGVDNRNSFFSYYRGYNELVNNTDTRFFATFSSKNVVLRVLGRAYLQYNLFKAIKEDQRKNHSTIIVYHSLGNKHLLNFLNRKGFKYILEIEEMYSDVITYKKKKMRRLEEKMIQNANAYILSTSLLSEKVDATKKKVICNGTYKVELDRGNKFSRDDGKIHCVYAGTFDPRKGGAAAAAAAGFLPETYHMHIIGFGSREDTEYIKKIIADTAHIAKAGVTYDGLKTGDEYINFIQSCDIGLSTQNPNAEFNGTSFPSKILSYLSNGLRVVSIKIPAVEQSEIGDKLFYYETQTPEEIAKAIMSVDISTEYNSRALIANLNKEFCEQVAGLIRG